MKKRFSEGQIICFLREAEAGLIVMTAFISPFQAECERARQLIGAKQIIEMYVDTPLEVCR